MSTQLTSEGWRGTDADTDQRLWARIAEPVGQGALKGDSIPLVQDVCDPVDVRFLYAVQDDTDFLSPVHKGRCLGGQSHRDLIAYDLERPVQVGCEQLVCSRGVVFEGVGV